MEYINHLTNCQYTNKSRRDEHFVRPFVNLSQKLYHFSDDIYNPIQKISIFNIKNPRVLSAIFYLISTKTKLPDFVGFVHNYKINIAQTLKHNTIERKKFYGKKLFTRHKRSIG
jgi:hypothetical protein